MPAHAMSGKAVDTTVIRLNQENNASIIFYGQQLPYADLRAFQRRRRAMKTGEICADAAAVALMALMAHLAYAQQPAERVLGLMKSVVVPASDAVFAAGKAAPK